MKFYGWWWNLELQKELAVGLCRVLSCATIE
jgi:hypothetical protein